jgi:hypothetical protein
MKHLLNNISEEEKNSILEQHKGGMEVLNENFNKMVNKKLGHVELFEQQSNMSDGKDFRNSNRIKLSTIKNEDDLNMWKRFDRPDLVYTELTGLENPSSVILDRLPPMIEDLMLFIAQKCEVPRDCALTIKNSNLVDIFIKNKKAIFDNLGIKPMTNLTRFKNYLSRQIDSKVKSLVNVD